MGLGVSVFRIAVKDGCTCRVPWESNICAYTYLYVYIYIYTTCMYLAGDWAFAFEFSD